MSMTKKAIIERIGQTLGEALPAGWDQKDPQTMEVLDILNEWKSWPASQVIGEAESVFGWTE